MRKRSLTRTTGGLLAAGLLAAALFAPNSGHRATRARGLAAAPGPCTQALVDSAQARKQKALEAVQARFTAAGQLTAADVSEFLAAADDLQGCTDPHPSCSSGYEIAVRVELGFGWSNERHYVFTGTAPGHCELSDEASQDFLSFLAPDGGTVLTSVRQATGATGRLYLAEGSTACRLSSGAATERRYEVTDNGVLVIDWDDGPVSRHWGRRAQPLDRGPVHVAPVDAATLRVTWPGGATLDLGPDGTPRGSNFLAPGTWNPLACATGTRGGHVFPSLEALPGQSFGSVSPDFVRN